MIPKEVIEVLSKVRGFTPNSICDEVHVSDEEKEVAVVILNILAAKGCLIGEATEILDYCKYVLQFCPVVPFE